MASVTRENIGLLNDKLTVKIQKEDYLPSFQSAVKDYSKKANIPGFRKGMVPAGMVKKMYGASIFYDEVIKAVEKEIGQYLNTEKPDIFAQPLPIASDLRKLDMNNPEDYDFNFEIGLKPEFQIPDLTTAPLTLHKVSVTEEMINEEIERLKVRHGKMTEPETVTSEDSVLNLKFAEANETGEAVEAGVEKDNSLLVKYFKEPIRSQLMGKKIDEVIHIQLDTAFEGQEKDWLVGDLGLDKSNEAVGQKYFNLTITKIGLVEPRELNEEFFNEVFQGKEIKTEEAFRGEVKEEIQKYWDMQSRIQLQDQIYHLFLEAPIEFPEQFLKRWLKNGSEKEKSDEEVESEFPSFANQLKWTLITDRLIRENSLDVTQEEIRTHMQRDIMQYFAQMNLGGDTSWMDSYVDRMMKDEKQVDSTYRKVITQKVFEWAADHSRPIEQEVTADELNGMQHHHH